MTFKNCESLYCTLVTYTHPIWDGSLLHWFLVLEFLKIIRYRAWCIFSIYILPQGALIWSHDFRFHPGTEDFKLRFPTGPLSSALGSYLQLHTFEFPLTYVIGPSNITWPKHFPCFLPTWIYLLLFQNSTSQQVAPPANQWLQQKLLDSSQISSTLISNLLARYVGFSPEAYSKFVPVIFHYFHPNLSWAIIVTHFSSTHSQSPPPPTTPPSTRHMQTDNKVLKTEICYPPLGENQPVGFCCNKN